MPNGRAVGLAQMEIPSSSQYPRDRQATDPRQNRMPLSYLVLRYGFSLLIFFMGATFLVAAGAVLIVPIFYITLGIYMSRVVERVVVWNDHLASLADIARVKRSVWIGWVFGIPRLIWDIWVVERM